MKVPTIIRVAYRRGNHFIGYDVIDHEPNPMNLRHCDDCDFDTFEAHLTVCPECKGAVG